jgi:serine/threonine-protein kinase
MVGSTVSHYKVLDELGGGGMGIVYRARDLKLDRIVALKFLSSRLSPDPSEKARFIHEAKAASALDHPNICTIYEIDETADGGTFIAMAAYEGETLDKRIASGPLTLPETIDIGGQIASGLDAAHAKGIVHRDIKTGNIMVTNDGQVKILDFGLAKSHGATQLTMNGTTLGTVPFMSPEQARGEEVDYRSDIWSLGVILYEMITGQLPFRSTYSEAVVYSILHDDPPPVTSLRSGVPMELERIVNKALRKDRSARYQHLDEMLTDLKGVRTGFESGKLGPSAPPLRRESRIRKRVYTGIALAVLVVICVGVYIARFAANRRSDSAAHDAGALPAPEAGNARSIAVLPFKNISPDKEQEYFCDGMTEQIITNLSNLQDLRVIARTSVMQFKNSDKSVPEIARELGVGTILEGSIRKSGNRIRITAQLIKADSGFHLWARDYDRELKDVFGVQDDVAKAIVAALKLNLTDRENLSIAKRHTQNTEAYQLYLKGLFYWNKRTEEGLNTGIEYFRRAVGVDTAYALAYAGLADSYGVLGYYSWLPPKEAFSRAKSAAMKSLEIDSTLAEGHAAMAIVLRDYDWNWRETEKEFKRALELNPGYATAHLWYANFFNGMGRHDDAIAEMKRALDLDPLSLIINADVGRTLYFARRYGEAIEQLRKTVEMDHSFALGHIWLGQVLEQTGKSNAAILEFRKGVSLSDTSSFAVARLAHAYAVVGNRDQAGKLLDQLKSLAEKKYVSPYDIGIIYAGMGDTEQAFAWLDKAYEERSHWTDFLTVDPILDPLRTDPRFAVLVKKMGLGK